MRSYAELEVALRRSQAGVLEVTLRFTNPESEAETPPEQGACAIDPESLRQHLLEPERYGLTLSAQLFDDERIRSLYQQVKTAVEASDLLLRLRVMIDSSAAELHDLRWELLADPDTGAPLATSEKTLFSRFMFSSDWRTVRLRRRSALKALVAVSEPSNLGEYGLTGGYTDAEIDRASASLGSVELAVAGRDEPLTLDRLVAGLREGVDLLYLVCHGAMSRSHRSHLFLQDDDGRVAIVDGRDLARRVGELPQPPRLVVLASCESGGSEADTPPAAGASTAQASLAPSLAEAGVQAVVAMQGRITTDTVAKAMPVFFAELLKDGQIDRAMAVARGAVRARPDSWMPALYLRLRSGRIWYEPHFAGEASPGAKWKSLCQQIRSGNLIPILGPDVGEHVSGTTAELATRLAEENQYPLAPHERSNLARVTQYLSIAQSPNFVEGEVTKHLRRQVLDRNRHLLGPDSEQQSLQALLETVAERRSADAGDLFSRLASLHAPVYVTASIETSLFKWLKAAGRQPVPLFCKWRPTKDNHPAEPEYAGTPSAKAPVVYHVFGIIGEPESLVLTEDDFFDYLIATAAYKLMPNVVRGSLTDSSLLFLGFPLTDWTFRVLFRMIMTLEGCANLKQYAHVGVQVDPEQYSLADVDRARQYLERYFVTDIRAGRGRSEPSIDIYWGNTADFLSELGQRLAEIPEEEPATPKEAPVGWF